MSLARKTVNFAREKSVSSPNCLDYIIFTDIYPVGRALRKTFGSNLRISCRFRAGLLDGYPRPRAAKLTLLIFINRGATAFERLVSKLIVMKTKLNSPQLNLHNIHPCYGKLFVFLSKLTIACYQKNVIKNIHKPPD